MKKSQEFLLSGGGGKVERQEIKVITKVSQSPEQSNRKETSPPSPLYTARVHMTFLYLHSKHWYAGTKKRKPTLCNVMDMVM